MNETKLTVYFICEECGQRVTTNRIDTSNFIEECDKCGGHSSVELTLTGNCPVCKKDVSVDVVTQNDIPDGFGWDEGVSDKWVHHLLIEDGIVKPVNLIK